MVEAKVVVTRKEGLHARPASLFVEEAMRRECSVSVCSSGKVANGKSMLQLLALGVTCGQEIVIKAEGRDEAEAVAKLIKLVSPTVV